MEGKEHIFKIKELQTHTVYKVLLETQRTKSSVEQPVFILPRTSCSQNPIRAVRRHSRRMFSLSERSPEFTATHFHPHVADMERSQAAQLLMTAGLKSSMNPGDSYLCVSLCVGF